ncbi:MAG: hypothetical protein KBA75_06400, partial [Alphaproteobacteria bacterium]|nr:hypothetical protein [Alphaproteobacteria bacterium]
HKCYGEKMPDRLSGFLIRYEEDTRDTFVEEASDEGSGSFSDALDISDWGLRPLSIALVAFSSDTIDYIALANRGKRVVRLKNRVDFSGLVSLDALPISNLESRLNSRLQNYFIQATRGRGGTIPPATWAALIEAVKAERPALVADIDRLLALRRYSGFQLSGPGSDILLQEREALGISLDIFSGSNRLRERILGEWAPPEGMVADINEDAQTATLTVSEAGRSSFLLGIPQRYIQEESAIQHDLFNWEGMTPLHESGTSLFQQGDRRLEVIYANRNDLEHTLGVDLIYYNEAFQLFVLVQYKLMHEESGVPLYRPDANLSGELSRMDAFNAAYKTDSPLQSHDQFRLSDDGFMLKLVPDRGLKPASGELIKGMYIPREYMHFLIGEFGPKGPRGGVQITFANAPRYLTNSQFASNIREGWIGTRGVQSAAISDLIRQYYETGRAVLVAYERRLGRGS